MLAKEVRAFHVRWMKQSKTSWLALPRASCSIDGAARTAQQRSGRCPLSATRTMPVHLLHCTKGHNIAQRTMMTNLSPDCHVSFLFPSFSGMCVFRSQ